MIAQRALRTARPMLRPAATPARAAPRRSYANAPSSSEVRKGSDVPWAVASVIGFGGLFVYLTAPGPKSDSRKHAHGHDDHKDETSEVPAEPKELPDGSIEHPEGFVEIKRPDLREDAPVGDKHLDARSIPDEHAFEKQSKVKREAPLPHDNTTFQHGIAAAKDGDHISDPKKVVAAAKTAKEEKYKAKAEASE